MSQLKILFLGDVSGRVGREMVANKLPTLLAKYKPDLTVANVENAAGGFGVTAEVVQELLSYGVDLCTGGDHTFQIKSFYEELATDNLAFIRAANYSAPGLPGNGYEILNLGQKGRVAIISMLGQEFIGKTEKVENPFWFIDEFLEQEDIKAADFRLIDFHAETTAEKLSFAWYVRDRVEAVLGTHTHVATADNRLLGGKTAYVTDVGQCGPYDASLWVDFDVSIHNFKYPFRKPHKLAETGPRILNAVLVSTENFSPQSIERVDIVKE